MKIKDCIEALSILAKYDPEDYLATEHDEIFAGHTPGELMDPDDAQQLDSLGWTWSSKLETWHAFA